MFDGTAFGEGIVEIVKGYVEREIAPLKAENESLKARLSVLEARPAPEKGEKGDPGEAGKDGRDGADGKDGLNGKDAAGIVEALKDSGELVLTLADGKLIRTGIRDGEKGADGRDGFSLDDYDEWFEDDGRTLVRRFQLGEDFKEFRHQTVLPRYRQIFKEGESYSQGDLVTWGGNLWHCNADTTEKPDVGPWVIAAKKGANGKSAK